MSNTTLHERVTVRDERGHLVLLFTRSSHGIRLAGPVALGADDGEATTKTTPDEPTAPAVVFEVQPTGLRKWWPRIKRIVR
jgi:hypothetical protein